MTTTRYQNQYLRAQGGLFTVSPHANQYFLTHRRWPSLEDSIAEATAGQLLLGKATLPASEADALLRLLFQLDITRHHLFPSYATAAQSFDYRRALFGQ